MKEHDGLADQRVADVLGVSRRLGSGEERDPVEEPGEAGGSAEDEALAEEAWSEVEPEDALPFLFTAIGVGTALVQISTIPRFQWLQQTVMLFILGVIYSVVVDLSNLKKYTHGFFGVSHHMWMGISPHLLLAVMLPVLITGDSISIDTSVAKNVSKQCMYLAGPGVIICAFGLALFFWVYIPYEWPFMLCLTMSSILAATDPVAVVSLLKELGASPALTVQIQGESLLNDGTAMVLFTVAYDILRGQSMTMGDIVIFLVKSAVCAVLLGFAVGGISVACIRFASNRLDSRSNLIQISITLCCAYWSWIIAEGTFHVSGVLCTVSSALVLADMMWPSIVSKEAMHHVWHTFEHVGNSTIFFVAGSLTGHNMVHIPMMDYVHLLVIYLVCTAVRGAMLYGSIPILNAMKHSCHEPVSVADATVMCWGGLRGALGLAMAIKVNVDGAGQRITPMDSQRVLFYVGGVALLTLTVNATTCPLLVKWLRLNRPNGTKQMMMLNIHRQMSDFAAQQSLSANGLGSHINSMLQEVEHAINSAVDKRTAENIETITGPATISENFGDLPSHSSKGTFDETFQMEYTEPELAELGNAMTSARFRRSRGRRWCPQRHSKQRKVQSSLNLSKKLEAAKSRLSMIPRDFFELLGLSSMQLVGEELEQTLRLLEEDGERALPWQLKPINDVFLSLVRAKYWASIEADEFIQGEGQCLLDSISGALGVSAYKLHDLHFMRKQLLGAFGEDPEVKSAILMETMKNDDEERQAVYIHRTGSSYSSSSCGDEPEYEAGCQRVVNSQSYNAFMVFLIAVVACTSVAVAVATIPGDYEDPPLGEKVVMHGCSGFFLLDFFCRLCAFKSTFLESNWRKLDACLTVLSLTGTLLEILRVTDVLGEQIFGSPMAQVVRGLMVLQLLRVHQLFRSVKTIRTIRTIRRLATGSIPRYLAGRLQVVTILAAFTRAHNQSQEELIKYFGKNGKVGSGIVARCVVESLTEVCDACYIAWRVAVLVNPAILNSLRTLRTCLFVTEDLCRLVEDAHLCGAMSEEDADSVLHPLKHHQYALRGMVHDAHIGIIPDTILDSGGKAMPILKTANAELDLTRGSDFPGSTRGGRHKTESSFREGVDASTQTDGPSCASERTNDEEVDSEVEIAEVGSMWVERLLASTPADAIWAVAAATKDVRGEKAEQPQCEDGWSVYTVDDLEPPPNPPRGGSPLCSDPLSLDVHL